MKYTLLLTIIISLLFYSCSEILPKEGNYPYDFKTKPVEGAFENSPFVYKSGAGKVGSQLISVDLYDMGRYSQKPDTSVTNNYGAKLSIDVPIDLKVHDLSEWNCRVIYSERENPQEYHMDSGAVQILYLDSDSLLGQIDVIMGKETAFNGRFIAYIK